MSDMRKNFYLGLVLAAFFAFTFFILIPLGIEVPNSHDPGQLPPTAYPRWVVGVALAFSVFLAAQSYGELQKNGELAKTLPRVSGEGFLRICAGFVLLFVFAVFLKEIGMLLGAFVLYACFAYLAGERNWLRLLAVDFALCGSLYVFFVRIATVPIPMGPLRGIL